MRGRGFSQLLILLVGLLILGILGSAYYFSQTKQILPSPSALPDGDYRSSPSVTPYQTAIPTSSSDENCQLTSCHGLEVSCGYSTLKACTAIYALGDRCRQFAKCEAVEGECQLIKDEKFNSCKACVENCVKKYPKDGIKQFDCESKC